MWNYIKNLWKPKPCEHYYSPGSTSYEFYVDETGQLFTTQNKFCVYCAKWLRADYSLLWTCFTDVRKMETVLTNLRLVTNLEDAMSVDVVRVRIITDEGNYSISSVDEDDDDLPEDMINIIDPEGNVISFPKSAVKALTAAIELIGEKAVVSR